MGRLLLVAVATILPLNAAEILVRAGTLLSCTMSEPKFSAKTAQLGDPTLCDLRPFRRPGQALVSRGFQLAGRLSDYRDPGHFFGKGWIKLEFDRMVNASEEIPVNAKVIAVRGYSVDSDGKIEGKGHPTRDAVGWLFPFLWPVKIVTLPARGPYPTMKGEVQLMLRLMDDIAIPADDVKTSAAKPQSEPTETASGVRRSFPFNPDLSVLTPSPVVTTMPPPATSGWRHFGEPTGAWAKPGETRIPD